ncbi:MAG: Holliday junction branch migration protein RuvA [Acidobacteria bacterium]|nr:Holliday junction branch migration protein RuvA [Acidobacteriota bacterium]
MIGFLRGSLLQSAPDRLLLDVGGVGYEVHIPLPTYQALLAQPSGQEVRLYIHTHLREDGISLFGFSTEPEKHFFELLIGVSGIGPKLARAILSGSSLKEILTALHQGDIVRLSKTPGVGKKTAERMVLELRDKVQGLVAELPEAAQQSSSPAEDLVSALRNLGYRPAEAERAVQEALRESSEAGFQELLRSSLKRLSRA